MSLRHFSTDTAMAIRRYWQDEPDGGVTLATEQDVEAIVDHAKVLDGQYSPKARWTGDFHQVASIPLTIFMELHRKGIDRDRKAFKRWLNDPDQRVFRTRPGKV